MSKPKVLIVDDDDVLLSTLQQVCESMGFEAEVAASGGEALSMLKDRPYAVLISDVRMPQMDGPTLMENMKKAGHKVPVILMTGYSGNSIPHSENLQILEKPFSRQQMQDIMRPF